MNPYFETDLGVLYHGDCLEIMPQLEPVDLVLTDPPYGINADVGALKAAKYRIRANGKSKAGRGWKYYGETAWDKKRPDIEVFNKIIKASKKQIIWGGNYFTDYLPPTMQWLVWDKGQRNFSLADCEFAWSSQEKASRILDLPRSRALKDGKVHPTQKPIALMVWCLDILGPGNVLDPFLGSGTTAVACEQLNRRWIGIEISEKYCEIAAKRIERERQQLKLFQPEPPKPKPEQKSLF
jgi:DNA modification methylase